MTHHNLILALIQDVSVGHISVTKQLQAGHRLNECVSGMMQCLVTSKMCKLYGKKPVLCFKSKEEVVVHQLYNSS